MKRVLTEAGFEIIENPKLPNSGSRICTNRWVTEHRHRGHVELLDSGNGCDLPFPPTSMVLVAEKPADS